MLSRLQRRLPSSLLRTITALYLVQAIEQLLPIVVIPFLARVLGNDGWGLVASAQAFAMCGTVTVAYGFDLAGAREVARDRDDADRMAELTTGILATQVLLACMVGLAAGLVRMMVPEFEDQPLLLWVALALAIVQGLFPLWFFVGQERVAVIVAIVAASKVLATMVIFAFVRGPEDGWFVLAAYAGAASLATAAGYALMLRHVRPGRLDLALMWQIQKLGVPIFSVRAMVLMHTALNSLLLLWLSGPVQVSAFAAGEKLCRPTAWLLHPINLSLLPRLSYLIKHDPQQAKAMARFSILVMAALGVGFGLAIGLLAPWLIDLLFGLPEYQPAVPVLRVMAAIIPMIVINTALVNQWMVPWRLDRELLAVVSSGSLINLTLAMILAPRHGALGMAWISVLVEAFILCGLLFTLRRRA